MYSSGESSTSFPIQNNACLEIFIGLSTKLPSRQSLCMLYKIIAFKALLSYYVFDIILIVYDISHGEWMTTQWLYLTWYTKYLCNQTHLIDDISPYVDMKSHPLHVWHNRHFIWHHIHSCWQHTIVCMSWHTLFLTSYVLYMMSPILCVWLPKLSLCLETR